uniref:Dentin sialophosphoprotein-like n=1 Tax=Arundo donax TaxID=35708 RepID=A0A0A9AMV9_ARUDO
MLHHSNSRNQRNRVSRIKTLLQATLLLGVVLWLLYQVKHSYDKKNEYLEDAEDQLAHNDRSMFEGRKEKAGSYTGSNMEMVGGNSDVITKPEEGAVGHHSDTFDHNEEKSGETMFKKDSTDLHEDDKRNTERSEAEEGRVNSPDGNTEARSNNSEDETTGHTEDDKHDAESNSDADSKSEVHSTGDDMPQNNHAQEENTGETSGTSHDEVVQGDESVSGDQINASGNGSEGEEGEKKEAVDTQTGSESLRDDAKTETSDGHATGTLPDETGNVPSVHNDNSQNDASESQGDTASATSKSSEHSTSDAVHIETGLEDESASSVTGSGDDKGNSVESNPSNGATAKEKTGTTSGVDEKSAETGTSNEASYSKEANSDKGSAATEATNDQAANTESGNAQGDSASGAVNGSSEEMKPADNQSDAATEASNNSEQVDTKIETITSTNDEHRESQGSDGNSGSNNLNGSGPEQTGKTETQ